MHQSEKKNEFILSININLTLLLLASGYFYLVAHQASSTLNSEFAADSNLPSNQILLHFKLDVSVGVVHERDAYLYSAFNK